MSSPDSGQPRAPEWLAVLERPQVRNAVPESEEEGERAEGEEEKEAEAKQAEKVTFACSGPGGILRSDEGQCSALGSRCGIRT